VFGGKSLLKWFAQLKTLPKLWVRTTDQGRSFVPGDGCSQSGDQQEASKTCIPGRLIIKLATA